jgi:hypothetical protein
MIIEDENPQENLQGLKQVFAASLLFTQQLKIDMILFHSSSIATRAMQN